MSTPGIDIRPLRELTGQAMFNEVFLDNVFVPTDCLVGEVDDGWRLARTTLANERVSMASGSAFGIGVESILQAARGPRGRPGDARPHRCTSSPRRSRSRCSACARRCVCSPVASRARSRACASWSRPSTSSGCRSSAWSCSARKARPLTGDAFMWGMGFLATRCLTIAGGTSEVQRNVIAERLLGLPRDAG